MNVQDKIDESIEEMIRYADAIKMITVTYRLNLNPTADEISKYEHDMQEYRNWLYSELKYIKKLEAFK